MKNQSQNSYIIRQAYFFPTFFCDDKNQFFEYKTKLSLQSGPGSFVTVISVKLNELLLNCNNEYELPSEQRVNE